jgi:hypothetical protein
MGQLIADSDKEIMVRKFSRMLIDYNARCLEVEV